LFLRSCLTYRIIPTVLSGTGPDRTRSTSKSYTSSQLTAPFLCLHDTHSRTTSAFEDDENNCLESGCLHPKKSSIIGPISSSLDPPAGMDISVSRLS
jgi:hypothetical protein